MSGRENLIPFNERTEEEQRKIATMGGKASGEARRRKRNMKDAIDLLLSQPFKYKGKEGETIEALANELGLNKEDIDNQMAVIISMFNVSMSGSKNAVSAATFLRDTGGDKPKETIEITKDIDETTKEVDEYLCKKKQN